MLLVVFVTICFCVQLSVAQNNWTLSVTGFDTSFYPEGIAVRSNGNAYVLGVKYADGAYSSEIFKSENQGNRWSTVSTTGLDELGNSFSLTISGNTMLIGGTKKNAGNVGIIFTSGDWGENWAESITGFDASFSPNTFAVHNGGDIYLAGSKYDTNQSRYVSRLYKSSGAGISWSQVTTTGLTSLGNATCMIISGNTMILGGSSSASVSVGAIYVSADNGQTWASSVTGFDNSYVPTDITVLSNGSIYMTCSKYDSGIGGFISRIYNSTDNGNTWIQVPTTGLSTLGNAHMIGVSRNVMILGGGNFNDSDIGEIYTSPLPNVYSDNLNFSQVSIYPNPATDIINVLFSDNQDEIIKVEIYSVLGQKKWTKNIDMQIKELNIPIHDLDKGIYFLVMISDKKQTSYKIVKN